MNYDKLPNIPDKPLVNLLCCLSFISKLIAKYSITSLKINHTEKKKRKQNLNCLI